MENIINNDPNLIVFYDSLTNEANTLGNLNGDLREDILEKAIRVRKREDLLDYVYSTDVVWQIARARDWGICLYTSNHCPVNHSVWDPNCWPLHGLGYKIENMQGPNSGYTAKWIRDGFTPFAERLPGWIYPEFVQHVSFYLARAGVVWGNQ